jgi:hypothetical protein
MCHAKTYFLLTAIILSVTVSCKKDEPARTLSGPPLQVHAGYDTIVSLPATTLALYGTVIMGKATKLNWRQISGPLCRIESPELANSGLTVTESGVYLFEFAATNTAQVKAFDSVKITVKPSIDTLEYVAIYPSYHLLDLPLNSVTVTAFPGNHRGTSPVNVASIQWSKIAGPASFQVESPNASSTRITNLEEGIYHFSCSFISTTGFVSTSIATIAVANTSTSTHEVILPDQPWINYPGWFNHISIDIYNHLPLGTIIKKVFIKQDCFTQWYELTLNGIPGWDEWVYEISSAGTRLTVYHDHCGGDTPDIKIVY